MKQWIIDRYNKGQDDFEMIKGANNKWLMKEPDGNCFYINMYAFLYSPYYGFAKVFWGKKFNFFDKYDKDGVLIGELLSERYLQQMAIAPDVLEYLEQFKDK